jgi:DNA-binding NtrC family response regulator
MNQARILVVDGEPTARSILARALVSEGLEVHTASGAAEALDKVDEVAPDIVLSDIELPGMSGLELLEALRVRHDEVVVILLNGQKWANAVEDAATADSATGEITRLISLIALQVESTRRRREQARAS